MTSESYRSPEPQRVESHLINQKLQLLLEGNCQPHLTSAAPNPQTFIITQGHSTQTLLIQAKALCGRSCVLPCRPWKASWAAQVFLGNWRGGHCPQRYLPKPSRWEQRASIEIFQNQWLPPHLPPWKYLGGRRRRWRKESVHLAVVLVCGAWVGGGGVPWPSSLKAVHAASRTYPRKTFQQAWRYILLRSPMQHCFYKRKNWTTQNVYQQGIG